MEQLIYLILGLLAGRVIGLAAVYYYEFPPNWYLKFRARRKGGYNGRRKGYRKKGRRKKYYVVDRGGIRL